MRLSLVFAGVLARLLACGLLAAGALVMPACKSVPQPGIAAPRPAVLVIENMANCAWRISAVSGGNPARGITVPLAETVRLELPAGTYEITQQALGGLEAGETTRHFAMPLAAGETYHWRLATLATVSGDLLR
jgi:hypothetical protein